MVKKLLGSLFTAKFLRLPFLKNLIAEWKKLKCWEQKENSWCKTTRKKKKLTVSLCGATIEGRV
jgi:hypothetical protein